MAFWTNVWGGLAAGNRRQAEVCAGEAPAQEVKPGSSAPKRLRRRATWALLALAVLVAVVAEMRTSWLQSRVLSAIARSATYEVAPGPSSTIRYPAPAPYTDRLGYSRLPKFLKVLEGAGFEVTAQARHSPVSQRLMNAGIYSLYGSKPQAGLRLTGHHNAALFTAPYPARSYLWFEEIPPVVVRSLVFIENREILDERNPYRNPAVEWDRLAGAVLDMGISVVNPAHRVSGGSTLATQIEKLQYSPGGRTTSAGEKARQMLRASLRAYRGGENTIEARRRIVRDYLNSLPLAAAAGHGEVHGLGDGLWAWFGADFASVNRLLLPAALQSPATPDQALAFRQVLSLLLAVNSPGLYLIRDPQALEERVDSYLQLLPKVGIISPELARAALQVRANLLRQAPPTPAISFVDRKGADAVRGHLLSLLGVEDNYALDRLDLTAQTTLDVGAQKAAARTLQQFHDPEFAARSGLLGDRLLTAEGLDSVIYSFTLYERTPHGNLLRVQSDNYNQPLNINEGTKLELGSTAKLRTLAHYLEIVAELHERLSGLDASELARRSREAPDPITRWAAEYLMTASGRELAPMLDASLARRYSASPAERFFTGGGVHTFSNFDSKDNGQILTVSQAFERSVNLVFVRLMRDIVRYHEFKDPERAAILQDPRHPARREYLTRFAEFEGAQFLSRFYQKYRGLKAEELEAALAERRRLRGAHPLEIWLLEYLRREPDAAWKRILDDSLQARRDAYDWLYSSRRKQAQDTRIQIMLEREAFEAIHQAWKRLGFPFDRLVPSYATALGSSGDNPAALAELAGIILNDGLRQQTVRIEKLHFAEGTPWETVVERKPAAAEQVMRPEVAAALRKEMFEVVETGTARRARGAITRGDGSVIPVGGKTGTGDNRIEIVLRGGRRMDGGTLNRTATFVFIVGDRFFGVITAFVPGRQAAGFEFTSALPVQAFRTLAQSLRGLIDAPPLAGEDPSAGPLVLKASRHESVVLP